MSTANENITPDTAHRTLFFQPAAKDNFDKSIQDRLKVLQAILPDYSEDVEITEYVEELRSVCG